MMWSQEVMTHVQDGNRITLGGLYCVPSP
jgi:hypothetical protein